ncbi:MAG TPA: hypothetical protein VIP09_16530, partial [Dehalococcoidia bacterium]
MLKEIRLGLKRLWKLSWRAKGGVLLITCVGVVVATWFIWFGIISPPDPASEQSSGPLATSKASNSLINLRVGDCIEDPGPDPFDEVTIE